MNYLKPNLSKKKHKKKQQQQPFNKVAKVFRNNPLN